MGLYIEVPNKITWLERHGVCLQGWDLELKPIDYTAMEREGLLPVVVVNNGFFAAAVAYCGAEYVRFAADHDRQKCVYACKIEDLKHVCPRWLDYRSE